MLALYGQMMTFRRKYCTDICRKCFNVCIQMLVFFLKTYLHANIEFKSLIQACVIIQIALSLKILFHLNPQRHVPAHKISVKYVSFLSKFIDILR